MHEHLKKYHKRESRPGRRERRKHSLEIARRQVRQRKTSRRVLEG